MSDLTKQQESYALVDFDNVRLSQPEARTPDMESNLLAIVCRTVALCHTYVPTTTDLIIRLYGGWLCQRGQYTYRANKLLGCLSSVRSRFGGIRVRADLALKLADGHHPRLVGLLRTDRPSVEQKMVDTLLAIDAVYLAAGNPIIIISDDDDFVPPLLACSGFRRHPVIACRERRQGYGLNDRTCRLAGVIIEAWGEMHG